MALQLFWPWSPFQFLNLYIVGSTPWMGISQSQGRCLRTEHHEHRINAHTDIQAFSGIRTQDPSVRAGEDGSCIRRRGHRDRHKYQSARIIIFVFSVKDPKLSRPIICKKQSLKTNNFSYIRDKTVGDFHKSQSFSFCNMLTLSNASSFFCPSILNAYIHVFLRRVRERRFISIQYKRFFFFAVISVHVAKINVKALFGF
jgi:hypothetical protein